MSIVIAAVVGGVIVTNVMVVVVIVVTMVVGAGAVMAIARVVLGDAQVRGARGLLSNHRGTKGELVARNRA